MDGVAKTPKAQKGYLETIKSKAEDIDRMLAKLFLFSKMELGEYRTIRSFCNLTMKCGSLYGHWARVRGEGTYSLCRYTRVGNSIGGPGSAPTLSYQHYGEQLKIKTKATGNLNISLRRKETDIVCLFVTMARCFRGCAASSV